MRHVTNFNKGGLTTKRRILAHIGVLCVDTSGRHNSSLLIVLIEDEWIGIDVADNDPEPGLVSDSVAIAEGRGAQVEVTGHIMEAGETTENKL